MNFSYQFLTTVRLGIKSLMLHKLRSLLTMLGIIFGVCSVIAMLAIGEGASYEAQQAIKKLGSQNIIIRSIKPPQDTKAAGASRGSAVEYGLTYDDGARIQSTIRGICARAPGAHHSGECLASLKTPCLAKFWERYPPIPRSPGWMLFAGGF